jgi:hypothetical protein
MNPAGFRFELPTGRLVAVMALGGPALAAMGAVATAPAVSTRAVEVTIPAGTLLTGARVGDQPKLEIAFKKMEIQDRDYDIVADTFRRRGKSETKKDVKRTVGGAVIGGVLGAVTGNTKRGVLIGTAAGATIAVATKGGNIVLPAGQKLRIRLAEPVTVNYREDVALLMPPSW